MFLVTAFLPKSIYSMSYVLTNQFITFVCVSVCLLPIRFWSLYVINQYYSLSMAHPNPHQCSLTTFGAENSNSEKHHGCLETNVTLRQQTKSWQDSLWWCSVKVLCAQALKALHARRKLNLRGVICQTLPQALHSKHRLFSLGSAWEVRPCGFIYVFLL